MSENQKKLQGGLFEWYQSATAEEKELAEKAKDFEVAYFNDVTFKPGTHIYDYFVYEPTLSQDGHEVNSGLNVDTLELSIDTYRFKVSRLKKLRDGATTGNA